MNDQGSLFIYFKKRNFFTENEKKTHTNTESVQQTASIHNWHKGPQFFLMQKS